MHYYWLNYWLIDKSQCSVLLYRVIEVSHIGKPPTALLNELRICTTIIATGQVIHHEYLSV
jgi:hypothetical protein